MMDTVYTGPTSGSTWNRIACPASWYAVGGREDILKVHAKNKPLAEDVDLKQVAQTTAGFTGADLENLLNEAGTIQFNLLPRTAPRILPDRSYP